MSAGTPPRAVRLPARLYVEVMHYLSLREEMPCVDSWTFTDFVVVAITEKLDKIKRGRKHYIKATRHLDSGVDADTTAAMEEESACLADVDALVALDKIGGQSHE